MNNAALSDGDWKIMKLLWRSAPQTLGTLTKTLSVETGWTKATVFVMLKRLIAKNAVRMEDDGKYQQYYPVLMQKEAETGETDSFLSRVYNGSVSMMVSSMAGRSALSEEEIDALRKILDRAEQERKEETP